MDELNEEICLYSSFNQDSSCFCVGTNKGYRIYNSYPLKCYNKRDIDGGISLIEILNRSNILAFVGTGNSEKLKTNKVVIYDFIKSKVLNEIISQENVINIKLKRSKIFIITENKIKVFKGFTFEEFEKIDTIKNYQSKSGIFGISLDPKIDIISYPSSDVGKLIIKKYDEKKNGDFETKEINAHQSEIVALVMNYDGSLVASASGRGTIIKIFKTKDSSLIQELRRGTEQAEIYSLAFNYKSQYIACSSNKGTIHIFSVKNEEKEGQNQKSIFGTVVSFFGIQNEYLNSEWSFAQYRLPYKGKSVVSFNPDNTPSVIVITYDGNYHQGSFDVNNGGECQTCLEKNILKLEVVKEE